MVPQTRSQEFWYCYTFTDRQGNTKTKLMICQVRGVMWELSPNLLRSSDAVSTSIQIVSQDLGTLKLSCFVLLWILITNPFFSVDVGSQDYADITVSLSLCPLTSNSLDFHPQAFLPQPPKPTIPFYSLALLTVLQGPVQVQSHLLYKCSSDHLHNVSFLWMLMGFVTCNQFALAFFGYVIIHVHTSVCFVRP